MPRTASLHRPAALLTAALAALSLGPSAWSRDDGRPRARQASLDPRTEPRPPLPGWTVDDQHMRLEALPSQSLLPDDDPQSLHLCFLVRAKEADSEARGERQPMNVALVLDRSGSMQGEKLARAKETASLLIDRLQPQDRLALVSYGSDVRVELSSRRVLEREDLHRAVRQVEISGSTNLYGGLEAGVREVDEHLGEGVNRVFLLSDGLANVGLVEPEAMAAGLDPSLSRGVTVTTIGVGLDFNETLMSFLAQSGRGRFYFVEEPERLAAALDQELRAVEATVARHARLELRLPPGVRLEQVYGHPFEREGQVVQIPLRDLTAGESRKVLVALRVAPGSGAEPAVVQPELVYTGPDRERHRLANVLKLRRSGDPDEVSRSRNDEVSAEVLYTSNAHAFSEASNLLRTGRRPAARDLLQQARDRTREGCSQYGVEKLCGQVTQFERRIAELDRPSVENDQRMLKNAVLAVEAAMMN